MSNQNTTNETVEGFLVVAKLMGYVLGFIFAASLLAQLVNHTNDGGELRDFRFTFSSADNLSGSERGVQNTGDPVVCTAANTDC